MPKYALFVVARLDSRPGLFVRESWGFTTDVHEWRGEANGWDERGSGWVVVV